MILHTPETVGFIETVQKYSGISLGSFFHESFQHDKDNEDDIYTALKVAINRFKPGDRIAIEMTGGKKTMGNQLFIAAGILDQHYEYEVSVCYIDYDEYINAYRKPEPETTRLRLTYNPFAIPYKVFEKSIQEDHSKTREMLVNPMFKGRNFKINNKLIFVLMPYSEEWSDVAYNVIKQLRRI